MKRYNKRERAVVYATYQAYARRTPSVLSKHLEEARKHDIVLGVKLVRGAYLGSDPRQLFWDSIEKTHEYYDNIARCMIERRYDGILKPVGGNADQFPRINFVLASHNAESVRKARKLRDQQARTGTPRIPMAYGQLMGMADHICGELLQEANARSSKPTSNTEIPQAYKYLVWGTMGECMKYMLQRGQENRDAVSRTLDARQALGNEIVRRLRLAEA